MKLQFDLATNPKWGRSHLQLKLVMGATVCRYATATGWDHNNMRIPLPGVTLQPFRNLSQVTCKVCHKVVKGFAENNLVEWGA